MASTKYTVEKVDCVRLWYHENLRVYHDRLNSNDDRLFLKKLLASKFPIYKVEEKDVLD